MSPYLHYLAMLEREHNIQSRVMSVALGPWRVEYLRRGWVTEDEYLTHKMVPFLDSEQEVALEINEDAGVYCYRSPQQRGRTVTQSLTEITRYALQVDVWLNDLALLIGIEPRHLSARRARVPDHLWHLGEIRIAGTHDFAPVFVGRRCERASGSEMVAVLADPIWPRGGVLLRHQPMESHLPRDHAARSLRDFVRMGDDRCDIFDASSFDRVLRGFVTPGDIPEPEQYFKGNRLKLPHFTASRELSPERAKIIKLMWGIEGKAPPDLSWAEVNAQANTGYQSFDDAFGCVTAREEVIEKVRRGRYRVRRNP